MASADLPVSEPRLCVVAVDDDALILRYLRVTLKKAGYRPVTVPDPGSVLPTLREESPDVVLLDLRLPRTDGFQVFRQIREVSTVPVIFISASNRPEDRQRALQLGASDYLVKPFTAGALKEAIDSALAEYPARRNS